MSFSKFLSAAKDTKNNRNIFWICWMFFAWGIASSMIFTLLPLFVVNVLGGSMKSFGLLEGGVIFMSFVSKSLAGVIIDIFKRKKPMLMCGTIMTIISKLSVAFAFNIVFVFIAKALDRFAKGLRAAPTDAMLADMSTKYGFAYSFKYMMNTLGSLTGSVITSFIVILFGQNYRLIFLLSAIPTVIALLILLKKIDYENDSSVNKKKRITWSTKSLKSMSMEYWHYIIIIAILMFARFSEGFITLRAKEIIPDGVASFPIFMGLYEICVVLVSVPVGKLSDKVDKKLILLYGIGILFITNLISVFASNAYSIIAVYLGAGIHMGATHGILSSVIAQNSQKFNVGTAFSIYYAIDGICLLASNYFAGISCDFAQSIGFQSTSGPFMQGMVATFIACSYIVYLLLRDRKNKVIYKL